MSVKKVIQIKQPPLAATPGAPCSCPRIRPRADGELEFVRNNRSGAVHVMVFHDPEAAHASDGHTLVARLLLHEVQMLCGVRLAVFNAIEGPANFVSVFSDDELCQGCHRALGDEADRAFEHETPA
jgi:hypothetical protein